MELKGKDQPITNCGFKPVISGHGLKKDWDSLTAGTDAEGESMLHTGDSILKRIEFLWTFKAPCTTIGRINILFRETFGEVQVRATVLPEATPYLFSWYHLSRKFGVEHSGLCSNFLIRVVLKGSRSCMKLHFPGASRAGCLLVPHPDFRRPCDPLGQSGGKGLTVPALWLVHSTREPGFKFSTVVNEVPRRIFRALGRQSWGEVSLGLKRGAPGARPALSLIFERLEVAPKTAAPPSASWLGPLRRSYCVGAALARRRGSRASDHPSLGDRIFPWIVSRPRLAGCVCR